MIPNINTCECHGMARELCPTTLSYSFPVESKMVAKICAKHVGTECKECFWCEIERLHRRLVEADMILRMVNRTCREIPGKPGMVAIARYLLEEIVVYQRKREEDYK